MLFYVCPNISLKLYDAYAEWNIKITCNISQQKMHNLKLPLGASRDKQNRPKDVDADTSTYHYLIEKNRAITATTFIQQHKYGYEKQYLKHKHY